MGCASEFKVRSISLECLQFSGSLALENVSLCLTNIYTFFYTDGFVLFLLFLLSKVRFFCVDSNCRNRLSRCVQMRLSISLKSLINKGDVAFSPQLLLKPCKSRKLKIDPCLSIR